jgi:hypothetical protein
MTRAIIKMISPSPNTTTKFGPSGSFMKKNIALELRIDKIPKITRKDLFGFDFIEVTTSGD